MTNGGSLGGRAGPPPHLLQQRHVAIGNIHRQVEEHHTAHGVHALRQAAAAAAAGSARWRQDAAAPVCVLQQGRRALRQRHQHACRSRFVLHAACLPWNYLKVHALLAALLDLHTQNNKVLGSGEWRRLAAVGQR